MGTPSKPDAAAEPLSAEAAAVAADQIAAQAAAVPSSAEAQAATDAAIAAGDRGPTLPAEADMDAFMATVRAQFDSMSAQIETLKSQQKGYFDAQGTPLAVRYAQAAVEKIAALKAAHPDAPQGHFTAAADAAGKLVDAAQGLVKSGGPADALKEAGAALEKFFVRGHWRTWGKHIDFSAVADDVETAVDEGLKLAA